MATHEQDIKTVVENDETHAVLTDNGSLCSSGDDDNNNHSSLKRSNDSLDINNVKRMKRRSSSSNSVSVGKCPPRDMKRLVLNKPYNIDRVAKWGDKLALFLSNPEKPSDNGFFKPPEGYRDMKFHTGGTITLNTIGYSSSRNKIAQKITIDSANAPCKNGCVNNSDPECGCCSDAVLQGSNEKILLDAKIFAAQNKKQFIPTSGNLLNQQPQMSLQGLLNMQNLLQQQNYNVLNAFKPQMIQQNTSNLFANNNAWNQPANTLANLLQEQHKLNMAMLSCFDSQQKQQKTGNDFPVLSNPAFLAMPTMFRKY